MPESQEHILEVQTRNPLSIRQLVLNYFRAVERFRLQCERSREPENQLIAESLGYAALAEALGWADSIDNFLREGPRDNPGTQRDKEWALGLPDEQRQLVQAFQRVRNLVHHRWWQAVATRIERNSEGAQVNQWIWGALPDGSDQGRGRSSDLDLAYAARLQGSDLLASLDDLAAVFWTKRGWQITRVQVEQPGHQVGSPLVFDRA